MIEYQEIDNPRKLRFEEMQNSYEIQVNGNWISIRQLKHTNLAQFHSIITFLLVTCGSKMRMPKPLEVRAISVNYTDKVCGFFIEVPEHGKYEVRRISE